MSYQYLECIFIVFLDTVKLECLKINYELGRIIFYPPIVDKKLCYKKTVNINDIFNSSVSKLQNKRMIRNMLLNIISLLQNRFHTKTITNFLET